MREIARDVHLLRAFPTYAINVYLLGDILALEMSRDIRMVYANEGWAAFVPYWAAWPFETLVVPRRSVQRLEDLTHGERRSLDDCFRVLLAAYDALFDVSFPYSMGWHGAPHSLRNDADHWRLHAHFFPPLLRSKSVRKYAVGFEMLAEMQRDLTPEIAATRLRKVLAS